MNMEKINEMSVAIFGHWNRVQGSRNISEHLKKVLGRKSILNLFKQFTTFLVNLPNEQKKKKPIYTAIFIFSLIGLDLDNDKKIQKYLKEFNLTSLLYAGLNIFIKGTDSRFVIRIKLGDGPFNNKLHFLSRFQGEFGYWDYIEFFIAVKMIYEEDQEKFWMLVKEDSTKLLLLNLNKLVQENEVPLEMIISLMRNQNELTRNIAFSLLTNNLRRLIERLRNFDKHKEVKLRSKRKELLNEIKREINKIEYALSQIDDEIEISLLFNYILSEKLWPSKFSNWMVVPEKRLLFLQEIRGSQKIKNLEDVLCCLKVIKTKTKCSHNQSKNMLFGAIIDVIVNFIEQKVGIYEWTEIDESVFEKICELLPKSQKEKLKSRLNRVSKKLWKCKIDEFVRFHFYLADQRTNIIINSMLSYL